MNKITAAAIDTPKHLCSKCSLSFPSRNRLFEHLKSNCFDPNQQVHNSTINDNNSKGDASVQSNSNANSFMSPYLCYDGLNGFSYLSQNLVNNSKCKAKCNRFCNDLLCEVLYTFWNFSDNQENERGNVRSASYAPNLDTIKRFPISWIISKRKVKRCMHTYIRNLSIATLPLKDRCPYESTGWWILASKYLLDLLMQCKVNAENIGSVTECNVDYSAEYINAFGLYRGDNGDVVTRSELDVYSSQCISNQVNTNLTIESCNHYLPYKDTLVECCITRKKVFNEGMVSTDTANSGGKPSITSQEIENTIYKSCMAILKRSNGKILYSKLINHPKIRNLFLTQFVLSTRTVPPECSDGTGDSVCEHSKTVMKVQFLLDNCSQLSIFNVKNGDNHSDILQPDCTLPTLTTAATTMDKINDIPENSIVFWFTPKSQPNPLEKSCSQSNDQELGYGVAISEGNRTFQSNGMEVVLGIHEDIKNSKGCKGLGDTVSGNQSAFPYTIRVLHRNSSLMVIDKPCGISMEALIERMRCYVAATCAIPREGDDYVIDSVSRLDQQTSGVVVIPLTRVAEKSLTDLFASRQVHKYYICIVMGVVGDGEGYCGEVKSKLKHVADDDRTYVHQNGKFAHTKYICMRVLPYAYMDDDGNYVEIKYSVCICSPLTGRTHQIRVHMCSIGHPLLGDYRYSSSQLKWRQKQTKLNLKTTSTLEESSCGNVPYLASRLCLHSYCIEIPYPFRSDIQQQTETACECTNSKSHTLTACSNELPTSMCAILQQLCLDKNGMGYVDPQDSTLSFLNHSNIMKFIETLKSH